MLHEFPPSHAESDMMFKSCSNETRYSDGRDRSVSPRSVLECPPFEVPLNSPPPLHPAFLVWCPKTRGLEFAQPPSPPSPYFGGRRRLPSEISTISTSSTDSSGFFGDASDREDDFEDFAWPPVPPPTPLSFQESVSDTTDTAEEPYPAATVEYLDRPPISSRHLPPGHSSLYRLPKDNLYKTKPCKFYFTDKSCIKGDKCNFIHDEWERALRPSRPKSEKRMPPPLSTLGRRPTGEAPRQPHPTTPRPTELHAHALPKRPAEDAQRARNPNFYPITWRVIGGGVLMGGRREICQEFMAGRCHEGADCKYAHPGGDDGEDSSLSNLYPYMSPLSPVQEEPAYVPSNHSPVALLHQPSICSPVLRSPPLSAHIPSSYTDERRRRGRRAKKPLTIIPPPIPEQPELVGYSAHRVLDGSTLRELETSPPPAAETPDLSPDRLDVASLARSLVRPLSTPPSLSGPRPQVVNLFAAEMP